MPDFFMTPVFIILVLVIFNVIFVIAMAKRYVKVGPNEALVVSGGQRGTRIVVGGGTFVMPIIEQAATLPLEVLDGEMRIPGVRGGDGAALDLVATLGVKIGRDDTTIRAAAEHFLSKPKEEILQIALRVVETRIRDTVSGMAPESIAGNLDALAQDTRAEAASALGKMGLVMDVFMLKLDSPPAA
jgi:flotillin